MPQQNRLTQCLGGVLFGKWPGIICSRHQMACHYKCNKRVIWHALWDYCYCIIVGLGKKKPFVFLGGKIPYAVIEFHQMPTTSLLKNYLVEPRKASEYMHCTKLTLEKNWKDLDSFAAFQIILFRKHLSL